MRMTGAVLAVALIAGCGKPEAPTCEATQWAAPAGCAATDLEGKLRCIPGLTVEVAPDAGVPGYTRYNLRLQQPADHDAPQAGDFPMRLTLLHAESSKPLVLSTSGYGLSSGRTELTRAFAANQLSYEHRFFGPSRPMPADWTKLTIRQAAADAHRIAEAFHWLYPGRWVNTGASKGGMTSVYHRRFHPCDVDATVAYVAPVTLGTLDPAYPAFLAQAGC
jgi:PS-10 peptidase S37